MRLFSFLLLSFVNTILLLSALLLIIGFTPMDNVYWVAMSTPLVWLLGMIYSYWDDHPRRPFYVLSISIFVSGVIVALMPVPIV